MCGIAGIVDSSRRPIDVACLQRMCDCIRHRGPDEEGYFVDRGVGLGIRRLSIIDLATGRQPIHNEDESVWVVFNGEIYNFPELREGLEKRGHRFYTQSDTETIVHAYEEYGDDCPQHLRGMFAFALWDKKHQKLLLARDRLGKKPLLYSLANGKLLFASEFAALLQAPDIPREVNREAIHYYLSYMYAPAPLTAFQGVFKLLPGHILTYQNGRLDTRRYWRLAFTPKLAISEAEAVEQFRALFAEAVRIRMVADVPLGAFLSGGIDSSSVVATMSQLSERPVKTFSIGFSDKDYDELRYARLVAQRFGTDHQEFRVEPKAIEILPTLVRHYGEPYADSSAIPTFYVSQMARQCVTVALNGDGGDELFAGYDRHWAARIASYGDHIPTWLREKVILPLAGLLPDSQSQRHLARRLKRFLRAAHLPPARRYLRWVSAFTEDLKEQLYSSPFKQETRPYDAARWLREALGQAGDADVVDALLFVDTSTYLPNDLLVKVDIASMANSLEARSPFLDHCLVEFVARLPSHFKLRGRTSKYLLKKAMAGLLPKPNMYRPKMGFGVPIGPWLRGELKGLLREGLLSERALSRGYFEPAAVRWMVEEHTSGRADYAPQLWALLMLELWHRTFMDGERW